MLSNYTWATGSEHQGQIEISDPDQYLGLPSGMQENFSFQRVKESELGDAVLVDADKNTVSTEYDDLNDLPDEIVSVSTSNLHSITNLLI